MKKETNQTKDNAQFIRVDYAIACIPDLNWTEKAILAHILNFKTKQGCVQKLSTIGRIIAMSVDTVSKSLNKLINLGYLTPDQHPTARRKKIFKSHNDDGESTVTPLVPNPSTVGGKPKARGIEPKGVGCTPKPVVSDPKGVVPDPQSFPTDPTPLESKTPDLPLKTENLLDSKSDSSLNRESARTSDHRLEHKTDSLIEIQNGNSVPSNLTMEDLKKRVEESKRITGSQPLRQHFQKATESSSYYNSLSQNVEGIINTDVSGASPGNSLPSTQGSGSAARAAAPTAATTEPNETSEDIFANMFNNNDEVSPSREGNTTDGK